MDVILQGFLNGTVLVAIICLVTETVRRMRQDQEDRRALSKLEKVVVIDKVVVPVTSPESVGLFVQHLQLKQPDYILVIQGKVDGKTVTSSASVEFQQFVGCDLYDEIDNPLNEVEESPEGLPAIA